MTTQTELRFDNLIASYLNNPRFLRRDWLAKEIANELAKPDQIYLLLTAAPGFGKTTFIAQLAHDNPSWLRYFIRRDQISGFANVGARQFLLRLGFQLAAQYPDLQLVETNTIESGQNIEVADDGSQVLGMSIELLKASPFYRRIMLHAEQNIRVLRGRVTGIHIDALITDPQLLPIADLQQMALLGPAQQLLKQSPQAPLVILIDALDELRYAAAQEDLLVWLTNAPATNMPANIRFILSSRPPDIRLRQFIDTKRSQLSVLSFQQAGLAENQLQAETIKDTRTYAERHFLNNVRLQTHWQAANQDPQDWTDAVVEKADGNLGYLDMIARALDGADGANAVSALLDLEELPAALEGLYAFFLNQVQLLALHEGIQVEDANTAVFARAWSLVHRRLLGVLAVAREPLTLEQLTVFANIQVPNHHQQNALEQSLAPFLNEINGRFSLYHATLPDFLNDHTLEASLESAGLYAQPKLWHRRIARHYQPFFGRWSDCDDPYGFYHLPVHLAKSDNFEDLAALLFDFKWLEAKLNQTTIDDMVNDFDLLQTETAVLVQHALQLAARTLRADKMQLATQVIGHLKNIEQPEVQQLVAQAEQWRGQTWLRPLNAVLSLPGGPLLYQYAALLIDSQAIASRLPDKTRTPYGYFTELRIVDIKTGIEEPYVVKAHDIIIRALATTPDGKKAITAGEGDTYLKVWDLKQLDLIAAYDMSDTMLDRLVATNDSAAAIGITWDNTIRKWDIATGQEQVLPPRQDLGRQLSFGLQLLWPFLLLLLILYSSFRTATDWIIFIVISALYWAVYPFILRAMLHYVQYETGADDYRVEVGLDRQHAVVTSLNKTLRIWNLETGKTRATIHLRNLLARGRRFDRSKVSESGDLYNRLYSDHLVVLTAIDEQRLRLIATLRDNKLLVWDLLPGRWGSRMRVKKVAELAGDGATLTALALTKNGRFAVSAADRILKVWDLEHDKETVSFRANSQTIESVAISDDARYVISRGGGSKVWDLTKVSPTNSPFNYQQSIRDIVVAQDETTTFAKFHDDGAALESSYLLKRLDLAQGSVVGNDIKLGQVEAVAITPDSQRAVSAFNGKLSVWSLSNGEKITTIWWVNRLKESRDLVITPDGQWAILATDIKLKIFSLHSQMIRRWQHRVFGKQTTLGRQRWRLLAVSANGERLVAGTGGGDYILKVWDLATRQEIALLDDHLDDEDFDINQNLVDVAISADGQFVAAATEDFSLRMWRVRDKKAERVLNYQPKYLTQGTNAMKITEDGQFAIVSFDGPRVSIFDIARREFITHYAGETLSYALAVLKDGRFVIGDESGLIHLLQLEEVD